MLFTPCIVGGGLLEAVTEAAENCAFGERKLTFHTAALAGPVFREEILDLRALSRDEINLLGFCGSDPQYKR